MLDCQQQELLKEEKEMLEHPLTGGVILFARNYYDKAQLKALIADIRRAAKRPILIAVDHEGGRVQRFRDGFTRLPAMGAIQSLASEIKEAQVLARACGMIMAYELKSMDIDFSFAPVLDVNGVSQVIGDRGFAAEPEKVVTLASALIDGMRAGNMPSTGKHFPGHGSVAPDSHVALPVDDRTMEQIEHVDLVVFRRLIEQHLLDAVMPAHVIYSCLDANPAGFSPFWLQTQLRQRLGFDGVIFSDDLSMHGASVAGDYLSRAEMALEAGCDMILACNHTPGATQILDGLSQSRPANTRLPRLSGRPIPSHASKEYAQACVLLKSYEGQI
ncbi:beta-N-acetylhexosaminidase [Alteromonas aestuariivivens]|uniref:Beta-hexosaminidase n=2 Tax=Alteromonas aestuariivivens TaxID=1938339 RepID=A0A3D8MBW9_9ALTE|nr:beta-N-acetylhexosaminidase [Alteromonas aestuariivivens]RDV27489.1 beta-N-acetylhexosaminidase [Alteromonas aestuariivivens]